MYVHESGSIDFATQDTEELLALRKNPGVYWTYEKIEEPVSIWKNI